MAVRSLVVLLLSCGLLAACGSTERQPETGIPDTLLIRALADAHLATARAARTGEDTDSLRNAAFAELGIDSVSFRRAIDAFSLRPEAFAQLYDGVTDHLRFEQDALQGMQWQLETPPDTLSHAHTDLHHGRDD